MSEIIQDRVWGTLAGQFVGDALGTTLEFKSAAACAAAYRGGLRDIVGGGPFGMKPGQVTDDGELAVTLARTLVDHGLDGDARARAYAAWMRSNPPDKGNAAKAAFGDWDSKVTARQMLARTSDVNGGEGKQANGALMRVSPLALYAATMAPGRVVELAVEDARLSHPSTVCQQANAAYVRAIQVGLHGGTRQQGWLAACEVATAGPVHTALHDVEQMPKCDGSGQGWVLLALRVAFHQLLSGRPFEDALVATVMAGGDTDTNGAITGALLGAFQGFTAIPPRWWGTVQACRSARPAAYQVGDALQLADLLVERGKALSAPVRAREPEGVKSSSSLHALVAKAGGKIVPHTDNPDLVVVKIPPAQPASVAAAERYLGVKPVRGNKYFLFFVPTKSVEHSTSSPASRPSVRTSDNSPIHVDWLPMDGHPGKVGLTLAPGKHSISKYGAPWARDLHKDLDRLRNQFDVNMLVCLLEDDEMARLKIPNLVSEAERLGMTVLRLPIPDGGQPPDSAAVEDIVQRIRGAALCNLNVVIHCQGGLGRAGTIGGCFLRACGLGQQATLDALVKTRGKNCPENEAQRNFIRRFLPDTGATQIPPWFGTAGDHETCGCGIAIEVRRVGNVWNTQLVYPWSDDEDAPYWCRKPDTLPPIPQPVQWIEKLCLVPVHVSLLSPNIGYVLSDAAIYPELSATPQPGGMMAPEDLNFDEEGLFTEYAQAVMDIYAARYAKGDALGLRELEEQFPELLVSFRDFQTDPYVRGKYLPSRAD